MRRRPGGGPGFGCGPGRGVRSRCAGGEGSRAGARVSRAGQCPGARGGLAGRPRPGGGARLRPGARVGRQRRAGVYRDSWGERDGWGGRELRRFSWCQGLAGSCGRRGGDRPRTRGQRGARRGASEFNTYLAAILIPLLIF